MKTKILSFFHNNGHLVFDKTCNVIQKFCYWPKQKKDILNFCNSCLKCFARNKEKSPKKLKIFQDNACYPLERVGINIVRPIEKSLNRNKFILVICDYFSKFCEAFALLNQKIQAISNKLINKFFFKFEIPKSLHFNR